MMSDKSKNNLVFPNGIGPHEGQELALMLEGKKPLAMFGDAIESGYIFPDKDFEPFVKTGQIIQRDFIHKTEDGRFTIRTLFYALPGEEWRIDLAYHLSQTSYGGWCEEAANDCREIGRLLGYKEADINTFINWIGRK